MAGDPQPHRSRWPATPAEHPDRLEHLTRTTTDEKQIGFRFRTRRTPGREPWLVGDRWSIPVAFIVVCRVETTPTAGQRTAGVAFGLVGSYPRRRREGDERAAALDAQVLGPRLPRPSVGK